MLKGYICTPEHRAKLSAANKGRPLSLAHRASLSKARKGIKLNLSLAQRATMRALRLGVPLSPAHKAAISAALKHRVFTPEHRAKISVANTGKIHSPARRAANRAAHLGVKLSPAHIEQIRTRLIKHGSPHRVFVAKCPCSVCGLARVALGSYRLSRIGTPGYSEFLASVRAKWRHRTPEQRQATAIAAYFRRNGLAKPLQQEHPEWQKSLEVFQQVRHQLYRPNQRPKQAAAELLPPEVSTLPPTSPKS